MTLYPNCKINIGLRIVRKREDGYHDLESIFYPIKGLYDTLSVEKAELHAEGATHRDKQDPMCSFGGDCHIMTEGIEVDCPIEDNLIYKCYRMMKEKYPKIGPVEVRFRKNIPFGAGLGGGSSDATHMAIALNEIFELGLSREQIARDVRALGADCPFFAYNEPCLAEGIGDILTPIDFPLTGLRLVMVKPDVHVSTKEAYGSVTPRGAGLLTSDTSWTSKTGLTGLTNDFEISVFPLHPELADIKKRLQDAGAVYAAMSGSGSTVFGLFEQDAEGGTTANFRTMEQELAPMIIFNDTLG